MVNFFATEMDKYQLNDIFNQLDIENRGTLTKNDFLKGYNKVYNDEFLKGCNKVYNDEK